MGYLPLQKISNNFADKKCYWYTSLALYFILGKYGILSYRVARSK